MRDYADARQRMVDSQLRTEGVTDRQVLAAMGDVEREAFVPSAQRDLAYLDRDIDVGPVAGAPRYLMEPAPFARLLQLADLTGTEVVLDVGCGTGYSTAVIARLAASVVGLEADEDMVARASETLSALEVDNAAVVTGPLDAGCPDEAPFDAIVVQGAVEAVPNALLGQLRDGGRLVAVVGAGRTGKATLYTRSGSDIGVRVSFDADVRSLVEFARPPSFVF